MLVYLLTTLVETALNLFGYYIDFEPVWFFTQRWWLIVIVFLEAWSSKMWTFGQKLISKNWFLQKLISQKLCFQKLFFEKVFLWKIVFIEIVFVNCDNLENNIFWNEKLFFPKIAFEKLFFMKKYFCEKIFFEKILYCPLFGNSNN